MSEVACGTTCDELHVCPPGENPEDGKFGAAIAAIGKWNYEPEPARWWALNDEYATAIVFCPFCGLKLP